MTYAEPMLSEYASAIAKICEQINQDVSDGLPAHSVADRVSAIYKIQRRNSLDAPGMNCNALNSPVMNCNASGSPVMKCNAVFADPYDTRGNVQTGKPSVELWFELETRCNLACRFCYNYWKDGSAPVPARLESDGILSILKIVLDVVDCSTLTLSGGEPLLRSDLTRIVAYLRDRGVRTVITTNGTLLTLEKAKELADAGVSGIQMPLHSTRRDLNDFLSGKKCWDETLAGLAAVLQTDIPLSLTFVATELNLNEFVPVLHLSGNLGIRNVVFNRFVPSGLGNRNREVIGVPADDVLLPVLRKAHAIAELYELTIHLGTPIRLSDSLTSLPRIRGGSCPVGLGQRRWTIGSEGSLRRCNHSGQAFADVLESGTTAWIAELTEDRVSPFPGDFEPCQLLDTSQLVQLSVR